MHDEPRRSCSMCGREISRNSLFCRRCGQPQANVLASRIVALLVAFMLVLCVGCFFLLHLARCLCDWSCLFPLSAC